MSSSTCGFFWRDDKLKFFILIVQQLISIKRNLINQLNILLIYNNTNLQQCWV